MLAHGSNPCQIVKKKSNHQQTNVNSWRFSQLPLAACGQQRDKTDSRVWLTRPRFLQTNLSKNNNVVYADSVFIQRTKIYQLIYIKYKWKLCITNLSWFFNWYNEWLPYCLSIYMYIFNMVTLKPRSFAVSGPTVWNTLPSTLRVSTTTLGQFQSGVKTILFSFGLRDMIRRFRDCLGR